MARRTVVPQLLQHGELGGVRGQRRRPEAAALVGAQREARERRRGHLNSYGLSGYGL